MDPIPDIQVREIPNTPPIPPWAIQTPPGRLVAPPVTVNLGFPIIDLPGCVEWHPDDKRAGNLPIEDPDGVKTLCPQGQYPSYDAMDYTPENLTIQQQVAPPAYKDAEAPSPPAPETDIPEIPKKEEIEK